MIKIIAAIGKNNELGKNNNLIWHLPEDLKFFKAQTTGKTVAMGKNTFNSLPKKLPNRSHIVLADSEDFNKDTSDVKVIFNVNEFVMECLREAEKDDVFIIGGASVYNLFINFADELYLTEINATSDADVYFPKFDARDFEKEVLGVGQEGEIQYTFARYYNRKRYDFIINA